jgi:DNA-directed RNA polymerase subunit A'
MKGNRSTSANKPGQCDIESRGFVTESYYEGLSPLSLFFHATASREGTIDTGIGVSLIGYMQRKMMKSFEDIRIDNKFGVSNNYGKIIQFCYGGDGYDTTSVKNVKGIYTPVDVKSVFDKLNFN